MLGRDRHGSGNAVLTRGLPLGLLLFAVLAVVVGPSPAAPLQTVCVGSVATIAGTPGDDTLAGTAGANVIDGGAGNDVIAGGDGADTICGGSGNDTIDGGDGADTIDGGSGTDTIRCGPGADTVVAGQGDVFPVDHACETGPLQPPPPAPKATARPQATGRTIIGTAGKDTLTGTPRADKLYGRRGNDKLYGRGGNDFLNGGPGADLLSCGLGRDTAHADGKDKVAKDCEVVHGLRKPRPSPPPPPPPFRISRGDLRDCLARAGLAPQDTGLFIVSSGGTNVEALGVRVAAAGRVLFFVFAGDAAGWVDYISNNFARGAFEVRAIGNVVLAYERAPSTDERDRIEDCLRR